MTKALRPLSAKRDGLEFKRATSEASKPNVSDLSVTLKYNPHHRTNLGPKEMPAVRVYRSDPEGVTLQIRRERVHERVAVVADALAVADAICEAAQKSGAQ